jgi:hypothetical protein
VEEYDRGMLTGARLGRHEEGLDAVAAARIRQLADDHSSRRGRARALLEREGLVLVVGERVGEVGRRRTAAGEECGNDREQGHGARHATSVAGRFQSRISGRSDANRRLA